MSPQFDRDPAALAGHFDVVVIGAGIAGVQIAREAAARGRRVLVVDKGDVGAGTSSATTKYLHGGIRYLEQGDFGVVRESLRERRILTLAAPHLVRQTRFLLPVWSWSRPGRALLAAGAALYDALAYDRNRGAPDELRIGHPRWLGADAARRAVPWLDPDELRGAVAITDTLNVHPERLLLALLLDAVSLGAVARTHTRVERFVCEERPHGSIRVAGVELVDQLDGRHHRVHADHTVNAAGPWMGEVLALLDGRVGPAVAPAKGVHLLTTPIDDAVRDAVMVRSRSGRHVVVSPWHGRSLIGPTDTPVDGAMDDVRADAGDVDELLAIANACRVPSARLGRDNVDDVTVGVRPLIAVRGRDSYSSSRRHEVYDHGQEGVEGLWSVAGGKWTTGRAMGEHVADRVLGPSPPSPTRSRPVRGAWGWAAEPSAVGELARRLRPDVGLPAAVRQHLARLYGTACGAVLDVIAEHPALARRVSDRPGCHDVLAQVVVAVRDEGACTLADVVDRRLVLGTLGPVPTTELAAVAAVAAPLLGWPDDGAAQVAEDAERRRARRARAWQRTWSAR